jgi:hypothetical protein
MIELKKRVFVLLNMTINLLSKRENRDIRMPISKVKDTLQGAKFESWEVSSQYREILKQVRTIMYVTDISVDDMIDVLVRIYDYYI